MSIMKSDPTHSATDRSQVQGRALVFPNSISLRLRSQAGAEALRGHMIAKPANARIRALFRKLQALAERGVDGEREVARRKLARLKARYDFTVADVADGPDLFSGRFTCSSTARPIYAFPRHEIALASSVKWAIEAATKVRCLHRGTDLLAEATPATARRLRQIADHIAQSFRVLLDRFCALGTDRCGTGSRRAEVPGPGKRLARTLLGFSLNEFGNDFLVLTSPGQRSRIVEVPPYEVLVIRYHHEIRLLEKPESE